MGGLEMEVNVYDLLDIYEREVSKNTKNKRKINNFERFKMISMYDIKNIIESGNYSVGKYNIFSISRPKYRIVMSFGVKDKIINHYVARKILVSKLDKYLDIRNCATRSGMGYDYGIKLLLKYLEKYKKYDRFYILRIDISKYFYSIDHSVLRELLDGKLDDYEYNIVSSIIDSTNSCYVNEKIIRIKDRLLDIDKKRTSEIEKIPIYRYGKGLPIGNMTSQFLSIFYLYKLDHYIVNDLKLKHMVRYMDDYVIFHHDKEYLKYALKIIIEKLVREYKLNVNDKKTFVVDSYNGFEFLGYRFNVKNNKIMINIKGENRRRRSSNIKKNNYLYRCGCISYRNYFNSMNNYKNSYKYIKNNKY